MLLRTLSFDYISIELCESERTSVSSSSNACPLIFTRLCWFGGIAVLKDWRSGLVVSTILEMCSWPSYSYAARKLYYCTPSRSLLAARKSTGGDWSSIASAIMSSYWWSLLGVIISFAFTRLWFVYLTMFSSGLLWLNDRLKDILFVEELWSWLPCKSGSTSYCLKFGATYAETFLSGFRVFFMTRDLCRWFFLGSKSSFSWLLRRLCIESPRSRTVDAFESERGT